MNLLKIKKQTINLTILSLFLSFTISAQVGGWNAELSKESDEALKKMIETTPKLQTFLDKAYGYVVFPKVTKAGLVIGGAGAKGMVYKNKVAVGESGLKQATLGLQAGGQQYSEIIFFETKKSYEHFINGRLKFDGQASATAIKKGVSLDIAYNEGVAVFTQAIGGLMFEASLGGQHFTFKPKD